MEHKTKLITVSRAIQGHNEDKKKNRKKDFQTTPKLLQQQFYTHYTTGLEEVLFVPTPTTITQLTTLPEVICTTLTPGKMVKQHTYDYDTYIVCNNLNTIITIRFNYYDVIIIYLFGLRMQNSYSNSTVWY